jgi:PadR family transcriptional regulator, regulatory protein PadR
VHAANFGRSRRPFVLDLGNIRVVAAPIRITGSLLDVAEAFLDAFNDDTELHGWAIVQATKRSGPTVYGVLDRMEDAGWVTGRWESQHPLPNKPRRRLYRLTPNGAVAVSAMLSKRRPTWRHRPRQRKGSLAYFGLLRMGRVGGAR